MSLVWFGMVSVPEEQCWTGLVWFGLAWFGMVSVPEQHVFYVMHLAPDFHIKSPTLLNGFYCEVASRNPGFAWPGFSFCLVRRNPD